MANIRPFDLPPAPNVPSSAAFVIDTGAVVQKATAEQIVDSAIPLASQVAAETGSGNDNRMSALRVKQAIDAQALSQDFLAGPDGAEMVGLEQGGTVQGAINEARALGRAVGPTGAKALLANDASQRVAPFVASSFMAGGTPTQPNAIGKKNYATSFVSDGVQTVFVVTPGFVVIDEPWINITINTTNIGVQMGLLTEGSGGFTVSGYGTNTITLTLAAPIPAGYKADIVVLNDENVPAPLNNEGQLQTVIGYDNTSAGVANHIISMHTHGLYGTNGANHSAALGGAFHLFKGVANIVAGGQSHKVGLRAAGNSIANGLLGGRANQVDGEDNAVMGIEQDVDGFQNLVAGRGHVISGRVGTVTTGKKAKPPFSYCIAHGLESATLGAADGGKMLLSFGWSRDTTDATKVQMVDPNGGATINPPSRTTWTGRIYVSAVNDLGTKHAGYSMDAVITKEASGLVRVNGSTSDVVIPELSNVGAPGWQVALRGASGVIIVYATGGAADNARFAARFDGAWASFGG